MICNKFLPLLLLLISIQLPIYSTERSSSAPYISGDSFRFWCDHTYDELNRDMNPQNVKKGDTIFVKTDYLGNFFEFVHPNISEQYILISHNSDDDIPGDYASYLDDPKIIAWLGQNVEGTIHDKLFAIPIGIANQCWSYGNIKTVKKFEPLAKSNSRNIMLYMNFSIGTYPSERKKVYNLFKNKKYCYKASPKNFASYLSDLTKSKFVLSPRGNGVDCHRTWEALLMGAIPIVRTSYLDPLFEDLPVLIIQDWEEIDSSFLKKKYSEISNKNYDYEKLYIDYWINLIDSLRSEKL